MTFGASRKALFDKRLGATEIALSGGPNELGKDRPHTYLTVYLGAERPPVPLRAPAFREKR